MGELRLDDRLRDGYVLRGDGSAVRGPGRRTVRELTLAKLRGPGDGLPDLEAFGDLRDLRVEDADAIDLGPVGALSLDSLTVSDLRATSLAFIESLTGLRDLGLYAIDDLCAAPASLPSSLLRLEVSVERAAPGGFVERMLEHMDWSRLAELRHLKLVVQGSRIVPADLGFVRDLPALQSLWISGVEHVAPRASPLAPPFRGVPAGLRRIRAHATGGPDDLFSPEGLVELERWRSLVATRLGRALEPLESEAAAVEDALSVTFLQSRIDEAPVAETLPWALIEPDERDEAWSTYGSLDVARPPLVDDDLFDEAEAADRAQAVVRAVDAALAHRIEWDPEASGTGLAAKERADLERALEILGITPPSSAATDE